RLPGGPAFLPQPLCEVRATVTIPSRGSCSEPVWRRPCYGGVKTTPLDQRTFNPGERPMLYWALMFLVVALIAAIFGFGGIASTATGIAQILFVVALVLFLVSLLANFMRRSH